LRKLDIPKATSTNSLSFSSSWMRLCPELTKRGFSFNFSKMRTSVFVGSLSLTMASASSSFFFSESDIFVSFKSLRKSQTTRTLLVWQPSLCLNRARCSVFFVKENFKSLLQLQVEISAKFYLCVFFTDGRYQLIQNKQKLSAMTFS
jgi:hypothetical protein